jgi:CRP-like cAMP-binding protein
MAMNQQELVDTLSGLALFADLSRPQLEAVAHKMTEESYPTGQRILRQGFTGTGFYVIVDGEVAVRIDGNEIARLGKGDFFGEMSILLGEPPNADIVATRQLRVLHLGGPELEAFLLDYPRVLLRMTKSIAMRLRIANRWRS